MIYSDVNSNTQKNRPLVFNVEAVVQAVRNLMRTRKGQRMFLPEYGHELDDGLFELIDETNAMWVYRHIVDIVNRWEPRVEVHTDRSMVQLDYDNNAYEVTLVFSVKGIPDNYEVTEVYKR